MAGDEIGQGIRDPIDVLGVSIASESIDQSLIDQSMQSRKKKGKKAAKKQKEDLDGSRLYREDKRSRGRDEGTPSKPDKQSSTGQQRGAKRK